MGRLASGPPWQWALYVFVVGMVCVLLIPLSEVWWIAALLGTVAPLAMALVDACRDDRTARRYCKAMEHPADRSMPGWGTPASTMSRWSAVDGSNPTASAERSRQDVVANAPCVQPGDAAASTIRISPPSAAATGRCSLLEPLSEREIEVLSVLASGRTTAEAANDLFVSVGTIKSHTGNIYRKLGAKNRTEAVARARELRLLP